MTRRATVTAVLDWDDWARDFPHRGTPGVQEWSPGLEVTRDRALLWFDERGKLRGVFQYCPQPGHMRMAGEFGVVVHPAWRRRGIATELLDEAFKRWPINLDRQFWTPDGLAFITAYEEDR